MAADNSQQSTQPASADFWREALQGSPPELSLPADKPKSKSRQGAVQQVPVSLSEELSHQVQQLAEQLGLQLHDVLLAAFTVLLMRYSRQEEVTIGCPVSTESSDQVHLLPICLDVTENPSFEAVAQKVQKALTGARQHANITLGQLLEAAGVAESSHGPESTPAQHPLFQAAFAFGGSQAGASKLDDYILDVALLLEQQGDQLVGQLRYSDVVFNAQTVERMAGHYSVLLSSAASEPTEGVLGLSFIDEEERQQVLQGFNATDKDLDEQHAGKTMSQIFEGWAERQPQARCLIFEGKELTYGEVNSRANQLAHHIIQLGVKPDSCVGIMMERSLELLIAIFAVLKAGAVYIPMDPEYPADRLSLIAEDSEAPVLLTQQHVQDKVKIKTQAQLVVVDTEWTGIQKRSKESPGVSPDPHRLMYMIFTSGSTGRPKGVMVEGAGLVNFTQFMCTTEKLSSDDIFLQKTPISFDASMRELMPPFLCGGALVIAPPGAHRDTQALLELIEKHRITCTSWVPSHLEVFVQDVKKGQCESMRACYTGGEALPLSTAQTFSKTLPHARLYNLYGPTETTVDVTAFDCQQEIPGSTVPIGKPVDNVRAYVLDERLQPLPIGVPGELMMSSIQVARGYLKREEENEKAFISNPHGKGDHARMYRTGDLARWLPDGNIEFLGRIDSQVKVRGFRIELGEIENVLSRGQGVQLAVVKVVDDKSGAQHLVGYVSPANVDVEGLKSHASKSLPEYMVPDIVMPLDELPRLPNGKINRKALPQPDLEKQRKADYAGPQNDAERQIQRIWHEVLKQDGISVDADFFQIGGNSLLAGKVMSRISSMFEVSKGFTLIFEARTIRGIAERVGGDSASVSRPSAMASADSSQESQSRVSVHHSKRQLIGGAPTSFSQEMLIFNNQLDPLNPAHNEPFWLKIRGDLNVEALYTAFLYLALRHVLLRSHFDLTDESGPKLKMQRSRLYNLPFSYTDLWSDEDLLPQGIAKRAYEAARNTQPDASTHPDQGSDSHRVSTSEDSRTQEEGSRPSSAPGQKNPSITSQLLSRFKTSPQPSPQPSPRPSTATSPIGSSDDESEAPQLTTAPTAHGAAAASFILPDRSALDTESFQRATTEAEADNSSSPPSSPDKEEKDPTEEIMDIRRRVKWALARHYLSMGLYSKWESGGKLGMRQAIQERLRWGKDDKDNGAPMARPSSRPTQTTPAMETPQLAQEDTRESRQLQSTLVGSASDTFDLEKGPLFRVNLFKVAEGLHVLLVTLHHTVTDGWSTSIICRELSAAYNSFAATNAPPALPPLPVQYADFAAWQRRWLKSGVMNEQLTYWKEKLGSAAPLWDFPCDFPRPNVPSSAGARVPVTISREAMGTVQVLMRETGSTMFMTLLAVWQLLLARCCGGVDDICVGAPVAGRNAAEAEVLIGAFLGAVAIRTDLKGSLTFRQLMERVREVALEAFENADVPFHLVIMEASGVGNAGASFAPIFQAMFFLHDESWSEGLDLRGCQTEPLYNIEKSVARFDLTLELTQTDGGNTVSGHLEYDEDIIARKSAVRLMESFQTLLASIPKHSDASIWDLPLVSDDVQQQLLQFELHPELRSLIPNNVQLHDDSWPVLLDQHHQLLPFGTPGDVHIASGRRDLSALQGQLQTTGIRARFTEDGKIQLIGLLNNYIVLNGYKVQMEEVEELVVSSLPQVQDALVAAFEHLHTKDQVLVAFVSPADVDTQALDLAYRKRWPLHLVPVFFQAVQAIPRLQNGQVDRDSLPQPDWSLQQAEQKYRAPKNGMETQIQLLWQAVLNQQRISCDADFSALGGNMLHAVIINAVLRHILSVPLPALDIFRERTIVDLAKVVDKTVAEHNENSEGKRAFIKRKAAEWAPRRPRLHLPGRRPSHMQ